MGAGEPRSGGDLESRGREGTEAARKEKRRPRKGEEEAAVEASVAAATETTDGDGGGDAIGMEATRSKVREMGERVR